VKKLPKSSSKTKRSHNGIKKKKTEDSGNDDNIPCGSCGRKYKAGGELEQEDWLQCMKCKIWMHETCAEDFGVIGDDDFFCAKCCD